MCARLHVGADLQALEAEQRLCGMETVCKRCLWEQDGQTGGVSWTQKGQTSRVHQKVSDLGIVQLAGLGQLALTPNGGVDAPQVGQGRCESQPVQHLHQEERSIGLEPQHWQGTICTAMPELLSSLHSYRQP